MVQVRRYGDILYLGTGHLVGHFLASFELLRTFAPNCRFLFMAVQGALLDHSTVKIIFSEVVVVRNIFRSAQNTLVYYI